MQGSFRLAEPAHHLEMVIARLIRDLERQARFAPGGGKTFLLPQELVGLAGADREDQRRWLLRQMPGRAVSLGCRPIATEHLLEIAEPNRLQIVQPAESANAPHRIGLEPLRT